MPANIGFDALFGGAASHLVRQTEIVDKYVNKYAILNL